MPAKIVRTTRLNKSSQKHKRAKLVRQLRDTNRMKILRRDSARCRIPDEDGNICGSGTNVVVHEILGCNRYGLASLPEIFSDKGRVVACPKCHAKAANFKTRCRIIASLQQEHGYKYEHPIWQPYLE